MRYPDRKAHRRCRAEWPARVYIARSLHHVDSRLAKRMRGRVERCKNRTASAAPLKSAQWLRQFGPVEVLRRRAYGARQSDRDPRRARFRTSAPLRPIDLVDAAPSPAELGR